MENVEGLSGVLLHRVDTADDAQAFMEWLGQRRPVLAIDTETTGLNTQTDRVRLIQFGDCYQGWTIVWENGGWGGLAKEAIDRYDGEVVFHNMNYDLAMLAKYGITFPSHRVHDTMIMAHVLDATRPVALKSLSPVYIDPKAQSAQAMLDHAMAQGEWTWATIPVEVPMYSVYAAMDTVLTARLHALFYPQVLQECPLAYDLERSFAHVVRKMEARGVRIEREYTTAARAQFQRYVDEVTAWITQTYGVYAGSNEQVIARLQQDGVQFTKMTKSSKRFALDKDVLELLIGTVQHPLAQAVFQRRQVARLVTNYLNPFLKFADADDLLHASMKSIGARTGRMSISNPGLQTLPRRSDKNPLAITIRNCAVPRDDHILVMSDFDQIEMRMEAWLAQDPGMAAAFSEGDFFVNIARELYSDLSLMKDDPRRQLTKNALYALSYGAGEEKIAITAGVPVEVVHDFLALLAARFPGIKRLQREVERAARERTVTEGKPYVMSPITRRRHYASQGKEYALVNYLIQGGAAEVLKMKTVELAMAGLDEFMVLLVHDEVILDVPRPDVPDVAHVLAQVMNDYTLFSTVPLTASTEFGLRWGEKGGLTYEEACAA